MCDEQFPTLRFKAIGHFLNRTKIKSSYRFTNNLQGLQKVMVKDFPWNIIPWNALLFEKTLKHQYQLSISRITDLFKAHFMTRRNVRKQGWVFPLFSPDSDDRLSLNLHRFVILYISCDTRSVGLGQYRLPKVYNGFGQSRYRCCAISLRLQLRLGPFHQFSEHLCINIKQNQEQ